MLAIYTSAAFSVAAGVAVAPFASIEVRRESDAAIASIFSDEDGLVPLANPLTADLNGRFAFYAAGLRRGYQVKATLGAEVYTVRNQAIGTAAQRDVSQFVGDSLFPAADAAAALAALGIGAPNPAQRQTARLGAIDSSGYANFLAAGAALNFNVDANPTPLVLDFAAGISDLTAIITADAANQGTLAASNTNFLHATYVSASSVTWGSALVPPQYGYAFDRTKGALLNFEGADASTTMLDDFGNTWTASGNAQLDTAQKKFGASSLLCDGTGDFVRTTNITTMGDGSWEYSFWYRPAAFPSGASHTLVSFVNAAGFGARVDLNDNAGTKRLAIYTSSDGSSWNVISAGPGATTTGWAVGTQYRIRFVFDALAGSYRVYLSNNGAAETLELTAVSTARVCAITQVTIGAADGAGTQAANGHFDAFRFLPCATNTSAETPSGVAPAITDYPVHFFSIPEMKMYEVTSASVSAGTNPGMTQRNRVFVGEADTGAATVSTVRTYALRGEYVSDVFALAVNTLVSKNHNIGVRPRVVRQVLVNQTKDIGYTPGDEIDTAFHFDGTTGRGTTVAAARNTLAYVQGASLPTVVNQATFAAAAITAGQWRGKVMAARGW